MRAKSASRIEHGKSKGSAVSVGSRCAAGETAKFIPLQALAGVIDAEHVPKQKSIWLEALGLLGSAPKPTGASGIVDKRAVHVGMSIITTGAKTTVRK
jgi:hypothetical protein